MVFIAILLILLSYFYGCFSTARIIAKSVRSLNIYKVGSGFADTENIYSNVSKPLGILVGALDVTKSYAYLFFLRYFLIMMDKMALPPDMSWLYSQNMLLIYGIAMLIGHCLPLTNHLRGGRGIFTYMGFIAFFSFYPMLITGVLALLLIIIFKQIRFSQYLIVLLPVILTQLFSAFDEYLKLLPSHIVSSLFTSKLLGIAVLMGILNFLVSKRLKEF
jgi:glycerol-3-phosphate acyltransferase PlsY